jgi:hypothetical protein
VLKFVNSSYFGFAREISSIRLAITLVGIRTIKNFALWSAVFSLMPNPKCGPFDLKSLWQDSLRRGLFARAMGRLLCQVDSEDLFAAALCRTWLTVVGSCGMSSCSAAAGGKPGYRARTRRFGWNHAGSQSAGHGGACRGIRRPDRMPHEIRGLLAKGATPGQAAVSLSHVADGPRRHVV